jgi:adenylate cyclase
MEKIGTYLTSTWSAVISAIILLGVYVLNPSAVETLRLKTFDYLIQTLETKTSEEIVLVEFGEKSVEKFGQWPFDRRDIAKIIQKLREHEAEVIAVPILMSEKDRAGGDAAFRDAINNNGVVLAQTPTTQNSKPDSVRRGFASIGPTNPHDYAYRWNGGLRPLDELGSSAAGVGVVASIPEVDGVVRRLPLLVNIAGNLYPSFPVETIRVWADDKSYQIKTSEAGIEFVRIPAVPPMATDERGRIWLSWNNKFTRIDATEIDDRVKGKHVILGVSIEGVGGIIGTPVGEKWSHEVQATALQTLIDGSSITRLSFAKIIELLVLSGVLGLLLVLAPRTSVLWTAPLYLSFATISVYGSYYMFKEHMQLWDASYLLLAGTLTFGHLTFNNFARENRLKLQIKKQFGTYLSPAMVEKLQQNPELLRLGGDTRELSIMFTDVRGFTAISEHYGSDVQGLTKIMNRYMTAMTSKILKNNGTLDKYIGDAQMAFWNAPLDDKDHARNAVKTALEMLGDLDAFNTEIANEGVPPFGMGLGINTGSVVVGNMGSDQRFDYTCLGDSVNLASRLEGQSKPYCVKMIIGERTAELVREHYSLAELDCIAVKGKTKGVRIFTVVNGTAIDRAYLKTHADFIKQYRYQNWDSALNYLQILRGAFKGELNDYYEMMKERIAELREANLPTNWDGVYRATSK